MAGRECSADDSVGGATTHTKETTDMDDDHKDPRQIPATMKALELRASDGRPESLVLVERPVPRPGRNQVLVRIGASPVNPSDLMFLRGLYGQKKKLPIVPGFEGSGEVIAAGAGWQARLMVGRRVACAAPFDGDGTWAEYMVTSASLCIPLRRQTSIEQGATLIVNPMTAWALLGIARQGRHRAVIQTAAASALGQMIVRLAARRNLPLVNIVRRREQVELLRQHGARHVIDSSEPDFAKRLRELCRELNVTIAFDAVAGEMTLQLMQAMPKGGRVMVYGALSEQACTVHPGSLIFEGKKLEGFWLSEWLKSRNLVSKLLTATSVQKLLATDLHTEVRARLPLEAAVSGLEQYKNHMTGGKILIVPGGA